MTDDRRKEQRRALAHYEGQASISTLEAERDALRALLVLIKEKIAFSDRHALADTVDRGMIGLDKGES